MRPYEAKHTNKQTPLGKMSLAEKQEYYILTVADMEAAIREAIEWIEDDRFDDGYISEKWYHDMIHIIENVDHFNSHTDEL